MKSGSGPSREQKLDHAAQIGALLFVSGEPLPRTRLATLLNLAQEELTALLPAVAERAQQLGLLLVEHGGQLQLVSAPELGPLVAQLLGTTTGRLSAAALETLAIIAYLQPVTRAEIEAIRGVDSGTALHTLLAHGLIEPIGRRSGPGQPVEYGTTTAFLERFGLADLSALPPLPEDLRAFLEARRPS